MPRETESGGPARATTEILGPVTGAVVARLVAVERDGAVRVSLPGRGPAVARLVSTVPRAELEGSSPGRELLVLCEGGDPSRPVIVGLLEDPAASVLALVEGEHAVTRDDPRHRVFTAEGSITLRCGEASLTLHADGRVVTRGVNVVSVASEQQRIQGAVVRIN